MTVTDAYAWVDKEIAKLPDVPEIHNSEEHGIDAGLDDVIGAATGLTGDFKGPATEAAEHFGKEALSDDGPEEPKPYRVPEGSIEDTFG